MSVKNTRGELNCSLGQAPRAPEAGGAAIKKHGDDSVESDEELESILVNAVREHKKNVNSHIRNQDLKEESRDIGRDRLFGNDGDPHLQKLINFFLSSNEKDESVEKSLNDYKKQGAIPKKKIPPRKSKKTNDNIKQTTNKGKVSNAFAAPENNLGIKSNKKEENVREKWYGVHKLEEGTYSSPFFYIVPGNPSLDFVLPSGSYYVQPRFSINPNSLTRTKVVFHPESSKVSPGTDKKVFNGVNLDLQKSSLENFDHLPLRSLNNLGKCASTEKYFQKNIKVGFEESKNLETIKSDLKARIEELKASLVESEKALEKLWVAESSLNLDGSDCSEKPLYEKTLVKSQSEGMKFLDELEQISALFPGADRNYLEEKVKACQGREDLFSDLVECELIHSEEKEKEEAEADNSLRCLQKKLPEGANKLYKMGFDCDDEEGELESLIQKQTAIKTLMAEFPDWDERVAFAVAEEQLAAGRPLQDFIAAQKLERKVESEFKRMVASLPDSNSAVLRRICEEFKGDELLADEYIAETLRANKITTETMHLLSILPDADPEFLKKEIEELDGDESALNILINRLLENGDYPKVQEVRDDDRKKLWKIYVEDFNVRDFLLKVPNPENFEEFGQNSANEDLIAEFINLRYPNDVDIMWRDIWEESDFNLTKTCSILDVDHFPVRLKNLHEFRDQPFDENLLKEICYIDNKREIDDYLTKMKNRKQMEQEEARAFGSFLTCPLCLSSELIASEAITCPEGHIFCQECIKDFINVKIADGVYTFNCPLEECDTSFTHGTLQQLLPSLLLSKIVKKQLAAEIRTAEVDGLESCPFCEFAYIPNPDDIIFKCQNSDCLIDTCRKCHEKNHIPLRCEEIERPQDLEARKKIEETMTEALLRACPSCGKKFVKIDGCNKITCSCGALICYVCRSRIEGYSHFHGHGLNKTCPLYSNNAALHETEVLARGMQVRNEIVQNNPEVRILHDPTTYTLP